MNKIEIVEKELNEHIRLLNSGNHKKCNCKIESAYYLDSGMYKCQYCGGILTDLERVKRIIESNILDDEL